MSRGDLVTVALQGEVDQPQSVARARVGKKFGHLAEEDMLAVSRSLAEFLGVI